MTATTSNSSKNVSDSGSGLSDAMIEANGLCKYYGSFIAAEDISFRVPRGEIVAFLGPNGAGKSTTMKMLTGYLAPSAGRAMLAGYDMSIDRLSASKRLGYLPENGPLYPFGFGLSYTNFDYAMPELSVETIKAGENASLSVAVTNSGDRKGKEVVQLYLRDLVATTARPVKELKAFKMIELEPGETKIVEFNINEEMLKFYNASHEWEAEEGEFQLMVGGNSEDVQSLQFNFSN